MRTNKYIPFCLALFLHIIPLSYFLVTQSKISPHTDANLSESSSGSHGIDLNNFSVVKKKINKNNPPQEIPTKTVGLSSSLPLSSPNTESPKDGTGNLSRGKSGNAQADLTFTQYQEPPYPPIARQKGYEGKVKIRVDYNPEGLITKVEILESSGIKMLEESVKKTALKWRLTSSSGGSFEKIFEFKLNN